MMPRRIDPRVLAVLILLFKTAGVPAQQLTLKRSLANVSWAGCPASGEKSPDVTTAQRREGEQLAEAAARAALLGDKAAALDFLTRAATLDPASTSIAYHHARTLDELNRQKDALAAYCRYLAIAPDAPDADEVRARTNALGSASGFVVPPGAALAFEKGLEHYDAQRLSDAEAEFGRASEGAPDWSDPLYNRAVMRLALGRTEDAASDLRKFLERNPGSPDSSQVVAVLATLGGARPAQLNAQGALIGGLLVPGLGHFTTRRPARGLLVLSVASGALAAGMLTTRLEISCRFLPDNGRCPPDLITAQRKSRPYLLPAIAVAVGSTVLGAIDAYRGASARNARAGGRPVDLDAPPRRVHLELPNFSVGTQSVQFDLVRVRF